MPDSPPSETNAVAVIVNSDKKKNVEMATRSPKITGPEICAIAINHKTKVWETDKS